MKEGLNLPEAEHWIERSNEGWAKGVVRFGIVDATDQLLGQVGFAVNDHYQSAEAFYWLSADARGRGVASRALTLVADWAFESGIERLFLLVHPENESSHRVAQRCGFSWRRHPPSVRAVQGTTTRRRVVVAPARRPTSLNGVSTVRTSDRPLR